MVFLIFYSAKTIPINTSSSLRFQFLSGAAHQIEKCCALRYDPCYFHTKFSTNLLCLTHVIHHEVWHQCKSSVMPKPECTATAAKPGNSVPDSIVFQRKVEA